MATLGVAKPMWFGTIGASIQDIGESLRLDGERLALPTRVTVGFAGGGMPLGPVDFGLSSALSVRRDGRVMPGAGVELDWSPIEGMGAVARFGGRVPERGGESPLTGGATVYVDRISLDLGIEGYSGKGTGVRIGVRVR